MWPFNVLFGRKLETVLYASKVIRVHGVRFRIQKINPIEFLNPKSVALLQQFATYNPKVPEDEKAQLARMEAARDHYKAVFKAGVLSPKLKFSDEGEGIPVDHLFTDWNLATDLYEAIMAHTYGKKKLTPPELSQETAVLKSTD